LAGYVRALRLAGAHDEAWRVIVSLGDTISAGTPSLIDLGLADEHDRRVLMRDAGVLAAQRGDLKAADFWDAQIEWKQRVLDESMVGSEWAGLQLDRAAIAAQRGALDQAIVLLRMALHRGLAYWPGLLSDPDLAPLHDHPAWRAMMKPAG
jgi:hypothetical protein